MSESINALTVPLLIVSSAVGAIEWSHDRDALGSILATNKPANLKLLGVRAL